MSGSGISMADSTGRAISKVYALRSSWVIASSSSVTWNFSISAAAVSLNRAVTIRPGSHR
jgi:hypothetical protein